MKQGEIWYANLNPTEGSEQVGFRPVVILSGNLMNQYLNVVIVCPLTTKIKNYKGNVVLSPDKENNLKKTSEIMVFHIRSIAKHRLKEKLGNVSKTELNQLVTSLNEVLKY
jgi:mRNA interferase MazF